MREYRVILGDGTACFYDVMGIMKKKWNWSIKYTVEGDINSAQVNKLKKVFPDVLVHGMSDAILGLSHYDILESPYDPLDKPILDEFADTEIQSIKMMDLLIL